LQAFIDEAPLGSVDRMVVVLERLQLIRRGGRLGVSFRRQVLIGPYIVDFLARRQRLIIEVDGGYHVGRGSADARRQRWLERQGYRVVRLPAAAVLHDTVAAVRTVIAALEERA
jgi:very-short-patch-repair endonuclease